MPWDESEIWSAHIAEREAHVVLHRPGVSFQQLQFSAQGEMGVLQFGYTVVNPGKHDIDDLTKDENFSTMMGDILTEILTKQQYETLRKDDNQEFDIQ
jgi:hypothetical protein